MLPFTLRRLLVFFPMLVVMSVLAFGLIQAPPGDYLSDYLISLQMRGEGSLDEIEHLKRRYGLDEPIYVQYWKWVSGFARWDLGDSLEFRRPVTELINERLGMTVVLGIFTIAFTWSLAIPIGIISAIKQYSMLDYVTTFLSYMGVGTPNFLLALVIMYSVFAFFDLKVTGLFSSEYIDAPWTIGKFIDLLKHIWVPMVILGTDGTARLTRIMRANFLDEMSKPYVETARAKGLSEWKLMMKYPARIAINPIISVVGWELPGLFSGSLIVASVMSLQTVGPLLLRALTSQDMYMAGSVIMILTTLTLIGTLISDILLAWTDPRIRMGG